MVANGDFPRLACGPSTKWADGTGTVPATLADGTGTLPARLRVCGATIALDGAWGFCDSSTSNSLSEEARLNMRLPWKLCRVAALSVCLTVLGGCAADPAPKKMTADDSLSKQARQMRANSTDETGTGLSDKSRDIEKDLGYR